MARSNEFGIASYGLHLFGAWSPKVVGPPRAFRRASRDCTNIAIRQCFAAVGDSGEQFARAKSAAIFPNSGDKFGVGNEPAYDMGNADLVAQALGNRGKQASHARQGVVKQRL